MAVDAVIVRPGPVSVPLDYQLPVGTEIIPKVVTATLDGTNAGGSFLAVLEVISPSGVVTARCLRQVTVAAGATAAVSWFPGGGVDDAAATDVDTAAGVTAIASPSGTLSVTSPTGPTADIDMPTTGVGAGTYGDATHSSQVTVDAEGRITAASSVPISGSAGAGGLIVLYDSGYLAANAASIDTGAGGIAAGHFALVVMLYVRTNRAALQDNLNIIVNNDAGAHYDNERLQAAGAAASAGGNNAVNQIGIGVTCASATEVANVFSFIHLLAPAYDQAVNFKVGEVTALVPSQTSGSELVQANAWGWRSTAAISRLAVSSATASQILAGSRMIVYGTQ